MTPDFSRYLDCGSVRVGIDDPAELISYGLSLEPSSDVRLHAQDFEQQEMGRIFSTSLTLSKDQDGNSSFRGRIEHSHKIDSPRYFSSKLLVALMRTLGTDNIGVTPVESDNFSDSYAIESDFGVVKVQTLKRAGHHPGRIDRQSRRNSLLISTELTADTMPEVILELLQIWATSIDLLSVKTLRQRSELRQGVMIDLRSVTGSDDKLRAIMSLEEYNSGAKNIASEITVPFVDFEDIDFKYLSEVIDDEADVLAAALAGCALKAIRIYGKTGIMPAISTQTLSNSIASVRNGADY